jgi:hypothetical protein
MQGKITLITPPDIFENESTSILFVHLTDEDQEKVSAWFAQSTVEENVNIYFYDQEIDIPWLLHSYARCDYRFIDLTTLSSTTSILSGYLLGKKNTFYKTDSENNAAICHYVNQNRITNIELFLEQVFNDKNGS